MMNKNGIKKAGMFSGIVIGLVCTVMVLSVLSDIKNDSVAFDFKDNANIIQVDDSEWHMVQQIDFSKPLGSPGEFTPTPGNGFLSCFGLDYASNATVTLANNETDWNSSSLTRGFRNYNNWVGNGTLPANDPFRFVVRCKFDATTKEGTGWNYTKYRVNLTMGGDESVSDLGQYNNSTSWGDAVVTAVGAGYIYINFWWDDSVDGYRILPDGSLSIAFSIWAKY